MVSRLIIYIIICLSLISCNSSNSTDKSDYARALIDSSLVSIYKNSKDSVAFNNLKLAEQILELNKSNASDIALCKYLIGRSLRENRLGSKSYNKLKEALHYATEKTELYTSIELELAHAAFLIDDNDIFESKIEKYKDCLNLTTINNYKRTFLLSIFHTRNKNFLESIKYRKELLVINQSLPKILQTPASKTYQSISTLYNHINEKDSAMVYAQKAVRFAEKDDLLNRYYYINLASLNATKGKYKTAYILANQAYELEQKNTQALTSRAIMRLEKQYDIEKQKRISEKEKNRIWLIFIIAVSLFVIISIFVINSRIRIHNQKKADKKRIDQLSIAYSILLKNISITPSVIKKIDGIANKNISNTELYDELNSISSTYRNKYKKNINTIADSIRKDNSKDNSLTLLSDKEMVVYILLQQNFSYAEIAQILSVSSENARAIYAKISKKLNNK